MNSKHLDRRAFLAGGMSVMAMGASALSAFASEAGNGGMGAQEMEWDKEADVVVVGYGFAGASSALGAAGEGASVIVLEKAPYEDAGGNSCACGGGMRLVDVSDYQAAHDYVRYETPNNVTDAEIDAFIDGVSHVTEWLDSINVDYVMFEGVSYPHAPGSDRWTGIAQGVGAGFGLYNGIRAVVEADDNIEIMYETPGCKLVFDPSTKEVFGVIALDADENPVRVKANKGVVMACGGFENNREMLTAYQAPNAPICACGTPYNTGDGIEMLAEIGAKMRGFSAIEWNPHGCKPASDEIGMFIGFNFYSVDVWDRAIMVNDQGKRFVNEAEGTDKGGNILRPLHSKVQLPELAFDQELTRYSNLPMFLITDSTKVAAGPLFGSAAEGSAEYFAHKHGYYTWSADNSAEIEKGWIKKADTIEELAEMLGIDPQGLAETVQAWNDAVDAGEDPECGRYRCMTKIEDAPFYGTELNLGIINTQGGGTRDEMARVIDTKGNVIPRLYEAGELGSMFTWLYHGAGNVPEALNGRYVGKNAAQLEAWA